MKNHYLYIINKYKLKEGGKILRDRNRSDQCFSLTPFFFFLSFFGSSSQQLHCIGIPHNSDEPHLNKSSSRIEHLLIKKIWKNNIVLVSVVYLCEKNERGSSGSFIDHRRSASQFQSLQGIYLFQIFPLPVSGMTAAAWCSRAPGAVAASCVLSCSFL